MILLGYTRKVNDDRLIKGYCGESGASLLPSSNLMVKINDQISRVMITRRSNTPAYAPFLPLA